MQIYDLVPMFENRKSYNHRAQVIVTANGTALKSYSTIVALIDKDGKGYYHDTYSATTRRHIYEFFKQNDIDTNSAFCSEHDFSGMAAEIGVTA